MLTAKPIPFKMDLTGSATFYSDPLYGHLSQPLYPLEPGAQGSVSGETLPNLKGIREKKAKTSLSIKRAHTSPVAGSLVDSESLSGAIDSKKRNKLGYHRTAVACGHCRRRKIRCIPSPDVSSSRCQNCIRLKKECHFFPVDQATPNLRKGRSDSKADIPGNDPEASVSSSSPGAHCRSGSDPYDSTPNAKRSPSNQVHSQSGGSVIHSGTELETVQPFEQKWVTAVHDPHHGIVFGQDSSYMGMSQQGFWSQNEHMGLETYTTSPYQIQQPSPSAISQHAETQFMYPSRISVDSRFAMGRQSVDVVQGSSASMDESGHLLYRTNTSPELDRRMSMPEPFHPHTGPHSGLNISMNPDYGYSPMAYPSWTQQMTPMGPVVQYPPHSHESSYMSQQPNSMSARYMAAQRREASKPDSKPG